MFDLKFLGVFVVVVLLMCCHTLKLAGWPQQRSRNTPFFPGTGGSSESGWEGEPGQKAADATRVGLWSMGVEATDAPARTHPPGP